jgi:hypothetical protein
LSFLLLFALLAQTPAPPRVSFSGYVQPQYDVRTADGDSVDRTLFRRMFFTLDARPFDNWVGQFQVDAGRLVSFGDRPVVKNAYIQYTGWQDRGVTVTIGNQKPPFSRSLLTSSSRRALIERSFTGDRVYGNPGRAPMVKFEGEHQDGHLYWAAAGGASRQVPDAEFVRIDGPAETGSAGVHEGPIASGRLEIFPLGDMSREQADFARSPLRVGLAVGTYGWWNDDDAAPQEDGSISLSHVHGYEISAAVRGGGAWMDAGYNRIDAEAIDPAAASGLYAQGRALLDQASIEGGYLFWQPHLEAVGMFDALTAEPFVVTWRRVTGGMNWYMRRHELKVSLMHRESFNERGVADARSHTTYLQMQFAF